MQIGIALGASSVRAVVLRDGAVLAATEAEISPGDALADAVAEVLANAPVPRWRRPAVVAALGPSRAQVRRIAGLPPLRDARALSAVVREGGSRFFLRTGTPQVTTPVRLDGPGTAWAATLDLDAVRAAEEGCARAGFRLAAAVPSVVVLPAALRGASVVWSDGIATAEVRIEDGSLAAVHPLPSSVHAGAAAAGEPVPALGKIGAQATHFADAYGAALLPRDEALALRAGQRGSRQRDVPGWRIALAGTALAASLGFALVAPAWCAMQREDRASARLAMMAPQRARAASAARELDDATRALAEIAAFDARRRSPSLLLAELTRALPAGSALVSFRVDSAGGSVVALAPRAAGVIGALERVRGVVSPEIQGAVTREVAAGRPVERVTVRFHFDAPSSDGETGRR